MVIKIKDKLIVKYELLDNKNIKVTFHDGTEDIISNSEFNNYAINNKIKMGFIIPK